MFFPSYRVAVTSLSGSIYRETNEQGLFTVATRVILAVLQVLSFFLHSCLHSMGSQRVNPGVYKKEVAMTLGPVTRAL